MTATESTATGTEHQSIHPETTIGHVNLKVADLERALAFYQGILGFSVTGRLGDQAAFLAAGDYHHLAVGTFESLGGPPPAPGTTGLLHFAIRYPNRRQLARAVERLLDHGVRIESAADHGVNEAIYLHDPDGNGVELYADRPSGRWPRDERGELIPTQTPLDLDALLAELDTSPNGRGERGGAIERKEVAP